MGPAETDVLRWMAEQTDGEGLMSPHDAEWWSDAVWAAQQDDKHRETVDAS